jgi:hypothetical protein
MAGYERKKLQLLGGGYNALPPVDKVPITDYLLAQNWRSDALGKLVSRAGYLEQFSIPGAGIAHSAGSDGGPSAEYYVACKSGISSPDSTVYYNGVSIGALFDGNRVGFAFMNGTTWIMNRGLQGRHTPGNPGMQAWNIAAPPASPSAQTNPGSTTPVLNVVYTYNLQGNPAYVHYLTIGANTYSIAENGYSAAQIPAVLAAIAQNDPNCAVIYDGVSQNLTIQASVPNTIFVVSGSDGNPTTNLGFGTISTLPNGTYQYYLTYMDSTGSLESNPSPVSNATTEVSEAVLVSFSQSDYPGANNPTDPRVAFVNVYRSGGTQSDTYRVGSVASTVASPANSFVDYMSDLAATQMGNTMPISNDAPPACAGIIGPFLSRLYAWSTAANPNRMFYTPIGMPQYWNTDPDVGDWFDVGLPDEAIVWCTVHTNLIVIYKERSIWVQIGDPTSGQLEQAYDGFGLTSAFALAPAGQIDYFVGPGSLCVFDMSQVHQISGNILPLFNQSVNNSGPLTPPGSILPGTAYNSTSTAPYAVALGHAMGRLYIGYAEQGTGAYNLLVMEEGATPEQVANVYVQRSQKWFYHRNTLTNGFFGFFFDGANMIGLSGAASGAALGISLADFRTFATTDLGASIECVYQSHYEDCGQPDNDKQYLEVAIDFEFATGANANVYVGFNNGVIAPAEIGTLAPGARRTVSFQFPLAEFPMMKDGGVLARNISVLIDVGATGVAILHNVYIFYYVEARLAAVASTLPTDLGVGKNKQCKELELDIAAPTGTVAVAIVSDLPGNTLATRQSPTVASGGRAIWNYPFPVTEGFLWQVVLAGASAAPFRLYSARLLMRVLGVYVQAYESAGGFEWDSMEVDLGDPDAKVIDQVRLELDTDAGTGTVHVTLSTDLPGEAFAQRGTYLLVNQTTNATPRAWVTVPLPDQAIEARSVRVQTSSNIGYRLYTVQVRWRKIGRYLVGSTPCGNDDAFVTFEYDYRSERRKMFKRIEYDMYADGTVTSQVLSDQDSTAPPVVILTSSLTTPGGRLANVVALPPGIRGRLMRVRLISPDPVRLYNIRVWARTLDDPKAVWAWEDFPLEPTDMLPHWSNLLIDETSPKWEWVDVPFEVVDS